MRIHRSLAVVAVSVWMVTCGDPQTRNPLKPSGPTVAKAEISGPASIAPGQSGQFSVLLHLTDGTVKTATNATWTSNASVLPVSSSGVATAGQQTGEAVLSVNAPNGQGSVLRLTREVLILPDGTYRLIGTVKDGEFPTVGVAGVRLDVTPGSASATTDSQGNYRLYGVPADASIHVAGEGYESLVQSVHLTGNASRSFQLTPSGPRLGLTGSYTLAIDAAPGCSSSSSLPTDLQHRSYEAVIVQTGVNLQVSLTEDRFRLNGDGRGNHFSGVAGVHGATFSLDFYGYYYYYYVGQYPSIAERLSNGTFLVVDGEAVVTGTPAGLSGQLNGSMVNWGPQFPTIGVFLKYCYSQSQQFRLTPR
jgi:hypothetical protein